jgi:hypothetical protein
MRAKHRTRVTCVFLTLLLALLMSSPAGALKICIDTDCCHSCDYFSSNGTFLYNITWCWSGGSCPP